MKKIKKWTCVALLIGAMCGCATESNMKNEGYSSVKGVTETHSFSFTSNLENEEKLYPLSTGDNYYVSSSFTGVSNGTLEAPFKTLEEVNALTLKAGDSVLFRKGETFKGNLTFSNISGEDDNPITFASYGEGERPIIESTTGHTINIEKASNVVVRDLKVKVKGVNRGTNPNDCRTGIRFYYSYVGDTKYRNIYIINNEVEGSSTQDNLMGITINSLESTAASSPRGIVTNAYVKMNKVHDLGRSGIVASGWLSSERINQNNSLMDLYKNFYFDNNVVYNVGCIGIYILACTDSTINRNLVHDTGVYEENQVMEGECGIMALGTKNCDILFNECYNVFDQQTGYDAMGIDIDWNTINVNVQYNYLHDCQGPGVGTMANQQSFIRNNRIENCRGETNHPGAISITNYTSRYACVDESMHAVKDLKIEDNLIRHTAKNNSLFLVKPSNGDEDFSGNEFNNNHLVYLGEDPADTTFVNVDASLPWYKFDSNKYYSYDTSTFKVLESTEAVDINISEGAQPYRPSRGQTFEAWQKRDLNATYELVDESYPANPYNPKVTYEKEKLTINWKENKGSVWHYNIFDLSMDEDMDYRKMVGQVTEPTFSYSPSTSGAHYYVIVPVSDTGVYGKALKIKVAL